MPRTIVVKIGGGEGIDPDPTLREIATLSERGDRVVLIHGGSHETNLLSTQLGHPPTTITSPSGHTSRRTDAATLDIFTMVYRGRINTRLVLRLRSLGVDAVGLSGIDGGLWQGQRKGAIRSVQDGCTVIIRDDRSGRVERVDTGLLRLLLKAGRTPVLTPPALDEQGGAINVDADRAAALTATSLGADALVLLSNVPGVLHDPDDPTSLITRATADGSELRNAARGRMRSKVLAACEASARGVARVVIASANTDQPIASALAGGGTLVLGEAALVGVPR